MPGIKRTNDDIFVDVSMGDNTQNKRRYDNDTEVTQFYSKSKLEVYRALSNFSSYSSKVIVRNGEIVIGGLIFNINGLANVENQELRFHTVEAAFQGMKYFFSNGPIDKIMSQILQLCSIEDPSDAKKRGSIKAFLACDLVLNIEQWAEMNLQFMTALITQKVTTHPEVRNILMSTGTSYLLHFTRGDNYWGGRIAKKNGERIGTNHLGQIYMAIRSELIV